MKLNELCAKLSDNKKEIIYDFVDKNNLNIEECEICTLPSMSTPSCIAPTLIIKSNDHRYNTNIPIEGLL